jgi:hypothetical protein
MVEFYQRKRRPQAVAVYCLQILERHPKSSYADEARRILAELGPDATRGFPGYPAREPLPELVPVPTDGEQNAETPYDATPTDAPPTGTGPAGQDRSQRPGRAQL